MSMHTLTAVMFVGRQVTTISASSKVQSLSFLYRAYEIGPNSGPHPLRTLARTAVVFAQQ